METEFQLLTQWLPRIHKSLVRNGQGIPQDFFRYMPRSKFSQKYICENLLASLDRENFSKEETDIENISGKRKGLFKKIDHLSNSEYYYIILFYFLLKRSYEQELNRIIEYISNKPNRIQCILALRHQVESSFNKAMKKVAETDTKLMEKVSQLKATFLNQFDTEMGSHILPVLTHIDILNKIAMIFQKYPEDRSLREKGLLRLANRLAKSLPSERPPHRPRDLTINQLIIFMRKYFGTTGITPNKAHEFIAQTINYCFFPKNPFDRNQIRLRYSDQWIDKGREKS